YPLVHPSLPPQAPEEAKVIDFDTPYTLRAIAESGGSPGTNVPISYRTYSLRQFAENQDTPQNLLLLGNDLGIISTNSSGYADFSYIFNNSLYEQFDPNNYLDTAYILAAYNGFASYAVNAFIIFPQGYLSAITMNATSAYLPDPNNPGDFYNMYIIQKGLNYTISSILDESDPPTVSLVNKTVTYYLITQQQLQQIQGGGIDINDLTMIGNGRTNISGISSVSTLYYNTTAGTTTDIFESSAVDSVYAIGAQYGQHH
ncbi:unnamed protein product, partial [marine sediment metagenome]